MPSNVILRMSYEPQLRELTIEFRDGRGVYRYFDVPMEEWIAFRSSASKGTHLNEVFKAKNYRFAKLGAQDKDATDEAILRWPA